MSSLTTIFDEAAADRSRGASEIERRLVERLLEQRRWWTAEELSGGAAALLRGQPAMANLRNVAHRLASADPAAAAAWLVDRAVVLRQLDRRLGAAAWPFVDGCERLLTVSRSSSVTAVVRLAREHGWLGEVVVFDGGPAGGGADQAVRLADLGGRVRSLPDAAMIGHLDAGVVVVGADAVGANRFVNVCGTGMLLTLARDRGRTSLLVADTGKDLPEAELDTVLAESPIVSEPGRGRRWPLFEAVPLALVSRRVSE